MQQKARDLLGEGKINKNVNRVLHRCNTCDKIKKKDRLETMATDKNRIMISLDDKNLEHLEHLIEDARDRRGLRLTKSQIVELLLNTVDTFDDIMGSLQK